MTEVAVTVLGGYLGAGKTTLLNHLLRTSDERIAVIVNDFGETVLDADLIEERRGDELRLANGCICCSMVDGFAAALDIVLATDPVPHRLVVEASGVADPAGVAAYAGGPGLRLDGVVVVADAEQVRTSAADRWVGDVVLRQLRAADVIVLNKVDLADDVDAVLAWLAEVAPGVEVVTATDARLPLGVVVGAGTGAAPTSEAVPPADERFTSTTVFPPEVERSRLVTMAEQRPPGLLRAKGLLRLHGEAGWWRFQLVGGRWTLDAWNGAPPDDGPALVAIGRAGVDLAGWLAPTAAR